MIRYGLLFLLLFTNVSIAEELTLPVAKDFLMDSQKVWKQKIPILIMFSIPDCEYCKKIKEDVLSPMAQMDEYNDKIIIRHIDASSFDEINNFYNEEVSHNEFAFTRAINFFPTVVLVDNYGSTLGKITGVPSEELYWTDLDEVIEKSTKKLHKRMGATL
ncbi:MAG: thioredoxin fold domain-containing protein [Gammaproteobacteria bacterium]|jgi:thioredoxin-related protein|nr:thioredoxin fold domain-containing protein [Gammaproteobacteria bacterium]